MRLKIGGCGVGGNDAYGPPAAPARDAGALEAAGDASDSDGGGPVAAKRGEVRPRGERGRARPRME